MTKWLCALVLAWGFSIAAHAAATPTTGSLVLTTAVPTAGQIVTFDATLNGLPTSGGKEPYVGQIELECEQNGQVVLEDYSYSMFYDSSVFGGEPYYHEFPLHFTGPASCEAHLFYFRVSNNGKYQSKRTRNNTLASVFFAVAG